MASSPKPKGVNPLQSPYYVQLFLSGLNLCTTASFRYLFSAEELELFHLVTQNLSLPCLILLARLQRRRAFPYHCLDAVIQRYQRDLGPLQAQVWDVVQDLHSARLIRIVPMDSGQGFNEDDCLDILWGLHVLTYDQIGEIASSIKGPIEDLWKQRKARKGLTKKQIISDIISLTSKCQVLSSTSLRSQLIDRMQNFVRTLITIPLSLRALFQVAETLLSFPLPIKDVVLGVGFFLSGPAYPLLRAMIVDTQRLPRNFYIETNTFQLLFTLDGKPAADDTFSSVQAIFPTRRHLERYLVGRFLYGFIETCSLQKRFKTLWQLAPLLEDQLQAMVLRTLCEDSPKFPPHDNGTCGQAQSSLVDPSEMFRRFSYEWTIAACNWKLVQLHESKTKHYGQAVRLLYLLTGSSLLGDKVPKLYNRLSINLHNNLKEPILAAQAITHLFRRKVRLPAAIAFEISKRATRVAASCAATRAPKPSSLAAVHQVFPADVVHDIRGHLQRQAFSEQSIQNYYISGTPLQTDSPVKNKRGIERPKFLSHWGDPQSVEQYVLDHYYQNETGSPDHTNWVGLHDEGGIIRELFGILMAGILLDRSVVNVFVSPGQVAPLDLFTELFYANRKSQIDHRLRQLAQLSEDELFAEILIQSCRVYPQQVIGVAWNGYDRLIGSKPRLRKWMSEWSKTWNTGCIFECLGRPPSSLVTTPPPQTGPGDPVKGENLVYELRPSSARSASSLEGRSTPSPQDWKRRRIEKFVVLGAIAASLGPRFIVPVFRQLCANFNDHRSGFPDLILWKTDPTPSFASQFVAPLRVILVEVKSESDRLSEKQRYWLSLITATKTRAEVCHVKSLKYFTDSAPGSSRKLARRDSLNEEAAQPGEKEGEEPAHTAEACRRS